MLSTRIDQIVNRRQEAESGISRRIDKATKWKNYVEGLLSICISKRAIWNLVVEDSKSTEQARALEAHLQSFVEQVNTLLDEEGGSVSLKTALKRAQRGYVNLGIIGPWRIGKSQIVQQLTHLDTWLIPTDAADNCTACPIHVINGNYRSKSNVAVISVYSIEEMCNNINNYIRHCGMENKIPYLTATTNDTFLAQCQERAAITERITNPGGSVEGFFDKMKEYLDYASDYYKVLSYNKNVNIDDVFDVSCRAFAECEDANIVLKNIDKEEVKRAYRPFVSYFAIPGTATHTFKCLASKAVTIYCDFRFLDENIGKLRLMDTPGIGECKLNVSEGLSQALKNDLDIAVATALAKPNLNDLQQIRDFHDILKKETDGRKPENWLYYMYNVYSTDNRMTSSILKNRHEFITKDLGKNIEGGHGITLADSHYADIDALINKGIICPEEDGIMLDTCRDETKSLSSFFDTILHEMVDSIEKVDEVFYKQSNKKYNEVEDLFEAIKKEISQLSIDSYDNQVLDFITKQMEELYKAIKHLDLDLKLYDHDEQKQTGDELTLSRKIKNYCNPEEYGKELMSVLNVTPKRTVDQEFEPFFSNIEDNLRYHITKDNWNLNQDFDQYIQIKRDLIEHIEKKVIAQFDKKQADDNLKAAKKKILDVYFTIGKLGEITGCSEDEWCAKFVEILDADSQYSKLSQIFKDFLKYQLTIEETLLQNIQTLRIKKQHRDQFIYDEDDMTPFDGYDKALRAFAYSLLNIEKAIKAELAGSGENSYEAIIGNQEGHFENAMSPIKTIPATAGQVGYSEAGVQLMKFYMAHSYVFKDEQAAAKNAVALEWKSKSLFNE